MVKVYIFKKSLKDLIEKDLNETNFDDIVYYFKGDSSSKRFDYFKIGRKLFEKMKSDDIKLEEVKSNKMCFKSKRYKKRKVLIKRENVHLKILKCFTKHIKKLSHNLMIILELHLRLNIKQFTEKTPKC